MIGYGSESGCSWTCGRDSDVVQSCTVFRLQKKGWNLSVAEHWGAEYEDFTASLGGRSWV